jgi:hypothetical protein
MQDMTDNRKVIAHFLLTGRFNLTNIGLVITGKFVDGDFVEDKNYICIAGAPLQVTNRYATGSITTAIDKVLTVLVHSPKPDTYNELEKLQGEIIEIYADADITS